MVTVALTKLELNILHLAADGKVTQQMADELHYSSTTIASARGALNKKMNARNMTHAVAIAIRAGLI